MSRLERLVVLLETGSTPFIRNTAADQLSDLAKGHPEEIISLVGRVYPFLKSSKWETRISAARAFGGIINHAELWDPNSEQSIKRELDEEIFIKKEKEQDKLIEEIKIKLEQDEELKKIDDNLSSLTTFDSFDLAEILNSGKKFLASNSEDLPNTINTSIDDSEIDQSFSTNSILHKIKKRKTIKPELEDTDMVKSESGANSLSPHPSSSTSNTPPPPSASTTTPQPEEKKPMSSARLKAMQKRKAKVQAKSGAGRIHTVDISQSSLSRQLVEDGEGINNDDMDDSNNPQFDITSQQGGEKLVVEARAPELSPLLSQHNKVAGMIWQFQGVFELLLDDLFDDKWEIRHGAALGLRELMKNQAGGAGRIMKKSKSENDANNSRTLEDLAVRLCTLFALDRFGDYVSDTVVAPVRESACQALGVLLNHLTESLVIKTFNCLSTLVLQESSGVKLKCWEAKHGGILGLRYLVSVRKDVLINSPQLLDDVVDIVLHGLRENDDDVQSVAALTLTPIASEFVSHKQNLIHTLLSVLWDSLINLRDDLSASIGSIMDLLSKLCDHQQVIDIMQEDSMTESFEKLVPRLYPFLRHSISNVRKSVLNTISKFLDIKDPSTKTWINSQALRLIFQNLLVEQNQEILQLSLVLYDKLLHQLDINKSSLSSIESIFDYQSLITLLMTPIGYSRHNYKMNTTLIIRPSGHSVGPLQDDTNGTKSSKKRKQADLLPPKSDIPIDELKVNIDAPIYNGDVMLVGYDKFIAIKCAAAHAFGNTLSYIQDEAILATIFKQLTTYLNSSHSTSRLVASLILEEFANELKSRDLKPTSIIGVDGFNEPISNILQNPDQLPHFRELVPTLKSVRTSCLQLLDIFITMAKVPPSKIPLLPVIVQGESEAGPVAFGVEVAEKLINETFEKLKKGLSATYKMTANQALEDAKHRIIIAIDEAKIARSNRVVSILASYSACSIALFGIPKKLNPVIRSLMDSVKEEEIYLLQKRSAKAVSKLIEELNNSGKKGASEKIVKNLCAFVCVDTSEVPEFHHNVSFKENILSLRKEEAKTDPADIAAHERSVHIARVKRQGALLALEFLLNTYGDQLFEKVPKIKEIMLEPLKLLETTSSDETIISDELKGQSIIDALGIVRALLPRMNKALHDEIIDTLPLLLPGLKSDYSVFRYSSAKCFATICSVTPTKAFTFLVKSILPMLNNALEIKERQGAIETIYHVASTMASDILPYIVFLIVPVLGRMSDSDQDVRILATTTFASIIKLVPLEAGIPDPEDMPKELLQGRDRERDFIQQMMDPSKIKSFDLPVTIRATLRKYQQEGVNWLAFLNKYHLHGILCDDMGLGKTLQTICIVSSDHYLRAENYKEAQAVEFRRLPSLVVCPPSLTGHWEQELNQYAPFLKVLVYAGGPSVRVPLRSQIPEVDIVVTSYDVCRNDVEFVSGYDYNYCVLDEGHIIKNAASKLTKSVKRIRAEHRLILSGTPIQNNVLELWSLFDFLMPGFLGTEKIFHEKFAKPIAASRNSKTSSKEQEAGALALEALHKQVLPFMLRRLKEDVLSDLPPKIIQDYYCELSELQRKLYKDFAKSQKSSVEEDISKDGNEKEAKTHVFQALQYMRKLCNHPALVVSPNHPKIAEVMQYLQTQKSDIRDIEHSPKLLSLKTLLLECGIGVQDSSDYSSGVKYRSKKQQQQQLISSEGVISAHRALIFCQLKDMLDIVENDLLKKYLPSVTYMRLDGSTDPRDRQSIVRKFNEDPSIDVLLLTTKVGGLGLNLTGADTVIFVEHDWNPMTDLQAMDRAHRLGQKKVVNVYRLITKDTLEEKIMGLQKFKMNIANTIVNQQNAGLASMDTNQLLDLFEVDETTARIVEEKEVVEERKEGTGVPEDVGAGGLTGKAAGAVGDLAELWDASQYEDEYNLDNFIKNLK
ncbi:transcriptional accessory protein [Scheffersomyces coipomensis]|uniref:transcriptional accessory protein n=1 Tax=Scheffersomyces coipomensis TaxID=1788519 RepID=UPI00315C7EEE